MTTDGEKPEPTAAGNPPHQVPGPDRWWEGITRYQWLVLTVASLGWVFDAFEGQLYNIT